jgi:hypothetical protein
LSERGRSESSCVPVNRAHLSVSSLSRSFASTKAARVSVPILLALSCACTYMKMTPPPDADKAFLAGNNSCYLATAANMLAGAGYGNGAISRHFSSQRAI